MFCASFCSSWRAEAMGYSSVWEGTLGTGLIWEPSRGKFSKEKEKILWDQMIMAIVLQKKKKLK